MIEIKHTEVFGWYAAIRGMRNPLNSWDKIDSYVSGSCDECPHDGKLNECKLCDCFVLGPNDLNLMQKLIKAGSDHSKFMRYIHVQMDITAPLYWFKEFDTYRVAVTENSTSTMHKIHAKEFTLNDFSIEHLNSESIRVLENVIWSLNVSRDAFRGDKKNKDYWWQMIQLLPSSYNQTRTIDLNYQVLRAMYHARKNHKLDEWKSFCEWIKTLPYSELITD